MIAIDEFYHNRKKTFDAAARGCYTLCWQLYGFSMGFRKKVAF
jgi:hypothetical protein